MSVGAGRLRRVGLGLSSERHRGAAPESETG